MSAVFIQPEFSEQPVTVRGLIDHVAQYYEFDPDKRRSVYRCGSETIPALQADHGARRSPVGLLLSASGWEAVSLYEDVNTYWCVDGGGVEDFLPELQHLNLFSTLGMDFIGELEVFHALDRNWNHMGLTTAGRQALADLHTKWDAVTTFE